MKVVRLLDKAEDILAIDEISRRAFSARSRSDGGWWGRRIHARQMRCTCTFYNILAVNVWRLMLDVLET